MTHTIAPARAAALRLTLPPPLEGEVVMQPPGLGTLAECIRLDPKKTGLALLDSMAARLRAAGYTVTAPAEPAADAADAETAGERIIRQHRQAQLLFGPEHADLLKRLLPEQVVEVVQGLYLAAAGIDPTDFVAVQAALRRQQADQRSAGEMVAQIDALIIDLAAALRVTPAEVAKMGVADAVALHAKLAENEQAETKFEAALHGIKL